MSGSLVEIEVVGTVSEEMNRYVLLTDDGKRYRLRAIMPYEAVSVDHGTGIFAESVGKRVMIVGRSDGGTIWHASVVPAPEKKRTAKRK